MVFQCIKCGSPLAVKGTSSICKCSYCGFENQIAAQSETEVLIERARLYQNERQYAKALSVYEQLISKKKANSAIHWNTMLCRFGAEFDGQLPILNKVLSTAVTDDKDYKAAIVLSDDNQQIAYSRDATRLEKLRLKTLEITHEEEPFDIYICCSAQQAYLTSALQINRQLSDEGYRVFLPYYALRDKDETERQAIILHALSTARLMLILADGNDVAKENDVCEIWRRYFSIAAASDKGQTAAVLYSKAANTKIPDELSHLQAIDMSACGFYQDFTRGVRKLFTDQLAEKNSAVMTVTDTTPLLRRAELYIEDNEFDKAAELCAQILLNDPDNPHAHYLMMLSEFHTGGLQQLVQLDKDISHSASFLNALHFGDKEMQQRLTECKNQILYNHFLRELHNASVYEQCLSAAASFRSLGAFADSAAQAEQCELKAEQIRTANYNAEKENTYMWCIAILNESTDIDDLTAAKQRLESLAQSNYKLSAEYAKKCSNKIVRVYSMNAADNLVRRKLLFTAVIIAAAAVTIFVGAIIALIAS